MSQLNISMDDLNDPTSTMRLVLDLDSTSILLEILERHGASLITFDPESMTDLLIRACIIGDSNGVLAPSRTVYLYFLDPNRDFALLFLQQLWDAVILARLLVNDDILSFIVNELVLLYCFDLVTL